MLFLQNKLDISPHWGYNVPTMVRIQSKLIKDGNSTAVRIPKTLLDMSGLFGSIEISASKGQLVIRNTPKRRKGWLEAVQADTAGIDYELADWDSLTSDGFDEY